PGPSLTFPRLNLVTFRNVNTGIDWHICQRTRYHLADIRIQKSAAPAPADQQNVDEATLYAMPLSDVQSIDAQIVEGSDATPFGHIHAEFQKGIFSYHLDWQRTDAK